MFIVSAADDFSTVNNGTFWSARSDLQRRYLNFSVSNSSVANETHSTVDKRGLEQTKYVTAQSTVQCDNGFGFSPRDQQVFNQPKKVFIFSTMMANVADEAVVNGRHESIITYHVNNRSSQTSQSHGQQDYAQCCSNPIQSLINLDFVRCYDYQLTGEQRNSSCAVGSLNLAESSFPYSASWTSQRHTCRKVKDRNCFNVEDVEAGSNEVSSYLKQRRMTGHEIKHEGLSFEEVQHRQAKCAYLNRLGQLLFSSRRSVINGQTISAENYAVPIGYRQHDCCKWNKIDQGQHGRYFSPKEYFINKIRKQQMSSSYQPYQASDRTHQYNCYRHVNRECKCSNCKRAPLTQAANSCYQSYGKFSLARRQTDFYGNTDIRTPVGAETLGRPFGYWLLPVSESDICTGKTYQSMASVIATTDNCRQPVVTALQPWNHVDRSRCNDADESRSSFSVHAMQAPSNFHFVAPFNEQQGRASMQDSQIFPSANFSTHNYAKFTPRTFAADFPSKYTVQTSVLGRDKECWPNTDDIEMNQNVFTPIDVMSQSSQGSVVTRENLPFTSIRSSPTEAYTPVGNTACNGFASQTVNVKLRSTHTTNENLFNYCVPLSVSTSDLVDRRAILRYPTTLQNEISNWSNADAVGYNKPILNKNIHDGVEGVPTGSTGESSCTLTVVGMDCGTLDIQVPTSDVQAQIQMPVIAAASCIKSCKPTSSSSEIREAAVNQDLPDDCSIFIQPTNIDECVEASEMCMKNSSSNQSYYQQRQPHAAEVALSITSDSQDVCFNAISSSKFFLPVQRTSTNSISSSDCKPFHGYSSKTWQTTLECRYGRDQSYYGTLANPKEKTVLTNETVFQMTDDRANKACEKCSSVNLPTNCSQISLEWPSSRYERQKSISADVSADCLPFTVSSYEKQTSSTQYMKKTARFDGERPNCESVKPDETRLSLSDILYVAMQH